MSAPVLGFDLIRRTGGHRVAGILRHALELEPGDLPMLAAVFRDDATRAQAWLGLAQYGDGRTLRTIGATTADPADVRVLLDQLTVAPVGSLDGLLHCVREDVLGWTSTEDEHSRDAAVSLVCDAVAACYAGDGIDSTDRRRLAGPWAAVARRLPPGRTPDLGPAADNISALLSRVRNLSADDLTALRRVSATGARGTDWSTAVHNATWAVHLSGRIRSAASAQFALVETLQAAGMTPNDAAMGSWNLLSGALQALAVHDLLDSDTSHRLVSPAVDALGTGWISSW